MNQSNSRSVNILDDGDVRLSLKTIQLSGLLSTAASDSGYDNVNEIPDGALTVGVPHGSYEHKFNKDKASAYLVLLNLLSLYAPRVIKVSGKGITDAQKEEYRQMAKEVYVSKPNLKSTLDSKLYVKGVADMITYANYLELDFTFYLLIDYFVDVLQDSEVTADEIYDLLFKLSDVGKNAVGFIDMDAFYHKMIEKNNSLKNHVLGRDYKQVVDQTKEKVREVKDSNLTQEQKDVEIKKAKANALAHFRAFFDKLSSLRKR